jgi:hypothetical protein
MRDEMDKQGSQSDVVSATDVNRLLAVGKILMSVLTANEVETLQAYLRDDSGNPSDQIPIEFTEIQIGNTSVT